MSNVRWATSTANRVGFTKDKRYKIIGCEVCDDDGDWRSFFEENFTDFADDLDEDAAKERIEAANGRGLIGDGGDPVVKEFEDRCWRAKPGKPVPIPKGMSVKTAALIQAAVRRERKDGAKKYDAGKAPVMQGVVGRFPRALEAIALVSDYGRRKYGTFDGWEAVPDAFNRYDDALGRHTLLRRIEGEYDVNDSGLPHLAQRAWNALATLELALREGTVCAVPGNEVKDGTPVLGSNGVAK